MRTAILRGSIAVAFATLAMACGNGDDSSAVPEAGGGSPDATKSEGGGGEGGATASSPLKHIFYIMMENHSRTEIVGSANAPFITSLAATYGQATSYYGVTHPSSPNYLAAISGDNQGIYDDCKAGPDILCDAEEFIPADDGGAGAGGDNSGQSLLTPAQAQLASITPHWFNSKNIVDQLEAKGLTWVAYMEGIKATGDTSEFWPYATNDAGAPDFSTPRKLYAQKHNPFMYFSDIRTNASRMKKIVPFTTFASDLGGDSGASVPNFVWISPNQCNDMHGVSTANATALGIPGCDVDAMDIGIGDKFIHDTVTAIMASKAWSDGAAIVIVWDEDDYSGTAGCCNSPKGLTGYLGGSNVPAIVISSLVTSPVTSTDPYNHYSLLATIESLWGLDCVANSCGMTGSQLMTKLFVPQSGDGGSTMPEASASETSTPSEAGEGSAPSEAGSEPSEASPGSEPSEAGPSDASDGGTGAETSDAPTGG